MASSWARSRHKAPYEQKVESKKRKALPVVNRSVPAMFSGHFSALATMSDLSSHFPPLFNRIIMVIRVVLLFKSFRRQNSVGDGLSQNVMNHFFCTNIVQSTI